MLIVYHYYYYCIIHTHTLVLKARNLLAADTNGKSDPYCRVSLGQRVFSTTVQHNTLNPEWQQSIAFINDDLAPFATCQGINMCTVKEVYGIIINNYVWLL